MKFLKFAFPSSSKESIISGLGSPNFVVSFSKFLILLFISVSNSAKLPKELFPSSFFTINQICNYINISHNFIDFRVISGLWSHDLQSHNLPLYQLSYNHHIKAGLIGLEPTIFGLTSRSYIPLKLHPHSLFYSHYRRVFSVIFSQENNKIAYCYISSRICLAIYLHLSHFDDEK